MDDDTTKKIIKEKFEALPQSIQEIILSTHYEETLIEVGKQYQLNVEQMGILERETTLVMMGLTPTKDFETELTRELHIDKTKGAQIVKDINEKIFLKIRELLKLMNTPTGEEPSVEETQKTKSDSDDTQILNSAGIEIIPGKLELTGPIESRENILNKIENPETVHPILTQKLSASIQIPTVKTEHSLENITKTAGTAMPQAPKVYPKNSDPYRLPPEN